LQQIRQKCSKQDYQQEGKKWMKSAQIAHLQQNNYAYSNCVQTQMVQEQKMKKAKYWVKDNNEEETDDFLLICFFIIFSLFWFQIIHLRNL
jgi:hypothetical protein